MEEPESDNWKYWKWSTFYYNPQDKNRFVPRPDGLGLSPNYGHKTVYLIIGGILAIILLLVLQGLGMLKF